MISIEERIKQMYEPKHYEIVKAKQGYAVMLKGLYSPKYEVKKNDFNGRN